MGGAWHAVADSVLSNGPKNWLAERSIRLAAEAGWRTGPGIFLDFTLSD